jgi:hypothetical protein
MVTAHKTQRDALTRLSCCTGRGTSHTSEDTTAPSDDTLGAPHGWAQEGEFRRPQPADTEDSGGRAAVGDSSAVRPAGGCALASAAAAPAAVDVAWEDRAVTCGVACNTAAPAVSAPRLRRTVVSAPPPRSRRACDSGDTAATGLWMPCHSTLRRTGICVRTTSRVSTLAVDARAVSSDAPEACVDCQTGCCEPSHSLTSPPLLALQTAHERRCRHR